MIQFLKDFWRLGLALFIGGCLMSLLVYGLLQEDKNRNDEQCEPTSGTIPPLIIEKESRT